MKKNLFLIFLLIFSLYVFPGVTCMKRTAEDTTVSAQEPAYKRARSNYVSVELFNGTQINVDTSLLLPANQNLTAYSANSIPCTTLRDMSVKNIYQNIVTYSPQQLLELINSFNEEMFSQIEFSLSVKLMLENNIMEPYQEFNHHSNIVRSIYLHTDGNQVLTTEWNNTLKLWTLDGIFVTTFHDTQNIIRDGCISPDGSRILTVNGSGYGAKLWNWDGTIISTFDHNNFVSSAVFSPDGNYVLTGSHDHTAKLWNLNGTLAATFNHNDMVVSVAFSPDGNHVLTKSLDHTTKLWNPNGTLVSTFNYDAILKSSTVSPDKSLVLTISGKSIKLCNSDGSPLATFNYYDNVNVAIFSHDGKSIIVCVGNKVIRYILPSFSLREFALFLLVYQYNQLIQSNKQLKQFVIDRIGENKKLKPYCKDLFTENKKWLPYCTVQ